MTQEIMIAPLKSVEEYKACEHLQQEIWQANPVEVVPADLLITAQRHGGLVLGAFDQQGNMIGCLFGFAGTTSNDNPLAKQFRWQHCSHIVGVARAWRGKGVGYQLKLAQHDWALKQGYEIITWTYNPLETANAILNIGKLGALCACYLPNLYGELPDALNAGVLSDRFEVVWEVNGNRINQRLQRGWSSLDLANPLSQNIMILNPGHINGKGALKPTSPQEPRGNRVLVEVPYNFQAIKSLSRELAIAWQLNMRATCESAFEAGYVVIDVVKDRNNESGPRFYYLLAQRSDVISKNATDY